MAVRVSSTHQRNDNFTVRVRLEVVRVLQVLPQLSVVVDLAIDGKDDGLIRVGQGLGAGICIVVV